MLGWLVDFELPGFGIGWPWVLIGEELVKSSATASSVSPFIDWGVDVETSEGSVLEGR